jgi:hypothetical protein
MAEQRPEQLSSLKERKSRFAFHAHAGRDARAPVNFLKLLQHFGIFGLSL